MERLPKDIDEILLYKLSYLDILRLCQTNKRFANICRDDKFWKILLERDFEGSRYKNNTFRQSYEYIYNNINNTINELVENKLIANSRYANIENMKKDIFTLISNFIKNINLSYTLDQFLDLKYRILTILSGLPDELIGSGGFDIGKLGLDDIDNELEGLLVELGYEQNDSLN